MAETMCHLPIQPSKVNGLDTGCIMADDEMSTVGSDEALQIVIPLADRDCDKVIGSLSDPSLGEPLLPEDDDDGGGTLGSEKQPSNTSPARTGCHGGRDGSGIMENMAATSSAESIPSWSESNC
jgi:hypothetical protein